MSDILCLYYSRSGNTRQTMAEIAKALEAELVEFTDGVDRQGRKGYFRSGLDAMRRSTHPLEKFETAKPLEEYRLVILGSPVWAGRCASPVRGLLKRRGQELSRVAYVLTRGGDKPVSYTHLDVYKRQPWAWSPASRSAPCRTGCVSCIELFQEPPHGAVLLSLKISLPGCNRRRDMLY